NYEDGIEGLLCHKYQRKELDALYHHALKCFRAADAVLARLQPRFVPGCGRHFIRARLDRPRFLTNRLRFPPLEPDAESGHRFSERSCSNKMGRADDDSRKSHRLQGQFASKCCASASVCALKTARPSAPGLLHRRATFTTH